MTRPTRPDLPRQAAAAGGCRTPAGKLELCSAALFAAQREVVIRHGAEQYRLRLTRLNKLILTK
jgi:hemin uptake protein HemP